MWEHHSVGSTDPSITMFFPLSAPWGVGSFACFCPVYPLPPTRRPQVLPLVRAEQEQKAGHRAVFAFEDCQHCHFASPSLYRFWGLWLWLVLAHCQHARSLLTVEDTLILDAENLFFLPVKLWLYEVWQSPFFLPKPKIGCFCKLLGRAAIFVFHFIVCVEFLKHFLSYDEAILESKLRKYFHNNLYCFYEKWYKRHFLGNVFNE